MRNDQKVADASTSVPKIGADDASTARNGLEATIARIWAEVLGVDHVGLHDNFLLLGGESLLATQVVSEIRARLGYDISIRSIFVGTVAEVAAEIGATASSANGVGEPGHRTEAPRPVARLGRE